ELQVGLAEAEEALRTRGDRAAPGRLEAQRQAVADAETALRRALDAAEREARSRRAEPPPAAAPAPRAPERSPAEQVALERAVAPAQTERAAARHARAQAVLRAPFDGIVAEVNVSPGEIAGSDGASDGDGAARPARQGLDVDADGTGPSARGARRAAI